MVSLGAKVLVSELTALSLPSFTLLMFAVVPLNLQPSATPTKIADATRRFHRVLRIIFSPCEFDSIEVRARLSLSSQRKVNVTPSVEILSGELSLIVRWVRFRSVDEADRNAVERDAAHSSRAAPASQPVRLKSRLWEHFGARAIRLRPFAGCRGEWRRCHLRHIPRTL